MNVSFRTAVLRQVSWAALFAGALAPALITTAVTPAAAQEDTLVPKTIVGGFGSQKIKSFDISFVDAATGRYILGDRTNKAVDVVNNQTNQLILQAGKGQFTGATGNNDTSGPDGVMIVNHREIWAGDGDSTVKFFSLFTGAQIHAPLSTGGANRVDEMCFDPVHQIAMVTNNAEDVPFSTFISASSKTILGKISFTTASNGAEQCQFNPRTGLFYIAIPEISGPGNNSAPGGVAVIDPTTLQVITTFTVPIASCSGPQGLAIGPAPQILLGCNGGKNMPPNRPTAVINDGSTGGVAGSVFATLNFQAGADMVDYNPASNHYTLARSNNNPVNQQVPATCPVPPGTAGPQVIGVVDTVDQSSDPDVVSGIFNCPTSPHGGNHSIASDPVTNQTYFPVASTSGATLCGSNGGDNSQGCIVVFTDPQVSQCVAQGAPVVEVSGVLMTAPCPQ